MEVSRSESTIQKWLTRGEDVERRGLINWDEKLAELKLPDIRPRLYRTLSERVATLQREGLIDHPVLLITSKQLLQEGWAAFEKAGFNLERPAWCTIQTHPPAPTHPNMKGELLTPFSLINLLDELQWRFPNTLYHVTVFPYIRGTHQASLMVNSDRSVSLEVAASGHSVSKGDNLLFTANTPRFQSWPLRCSSENPEHLALAQLFLSKIPKVMCADGIGEEYKPGYYEMVAGTLPGTTIRRVAFNDYRNESGFTL